MKKIFLLFIGIVTLSALLPTYAADTYICASSKNCPMGYTARWVVYDKDSVKISKSTWAGWGTNHARKIKVSPNTNYVLVSTGVYFTKQNVWIKKSLHIGHTFRMCGILPGAYTKDIPNMNDCE